MPHPNGPAHEMGDCSPVPQAQLEQRYIVIKLKDVERLTGRQENLLYRLLHEIGDVRAARGATRALPCVVVEKDWPEYAPTLKAILDRVGRESSTGTAGVGLGDGHTLPTKDAVDSSSSDSAKEKK